MNGAGACSLSDRDGKGPMDQWKYVAAIIHCEGIQKDVVDRRRHVLESDGQDKGYINLVVAGKRKELLAAQNTESEFFGGVYVDFFSGVIRNVECCLAF